MASSTPSVMISSTFYDLRQIRSDLKDFVEKELGYQALLSEHSSFPIDPDADTIENCRRRVERNADILVLVIGGRYGYVPQDSSRSITNMEYVYARHKGIPIYVFIEKAVLANLATWKANPEADFSGSVDDPRVFEFIKLVREDHAVWTHEFERAHDVTEVLRHQFGHLMYESLGIMHNLRKSESRLISTLRGRSLRLALELPDVWEYRLFASALDDEVDKHLEARSDHRFGIAFGAMEKVELNKASDWMLSRVAELSQNINSLDRIVNVQLVEAVGAPGIPGDIDKIVLSARKLAEAYRSLLDWSKQIRLARFDSCIAPAMVEMAAFSDDTIEKIEKWGSDITHRIESRLASPDELGGELTITLNLNIHNMDGFIEAIAKATLDCSEQSAIE